MIVIVIVIVVVIAIVGLIVIMVLIVLVIKRSPLSLRVVFRRVLYKINIQQLK